jgi:hypothetical protein
VGEESSACQHRRVASATTETLSFTTRYSQIMAILERLAVQDYGAKILTMGTRPENDDGLPNVVMEWCASVFLSPSSLLITFPPRQHPSSS